MRLIRPAIDHCRTAPAEGRRRPPRPMGPGRTARPAPTAGRVERAARAAGGPDDRARYVCGCGCAFDAAVTTSVACPHCGTTQAW
jgi:hypothetical protein